MLLVQPPRRPAWGPANAVTATRASLVGVVAVLAAMDRPGVLVLVATVALVLDAVDGAVARRTGTVTAFGARFDMEVDAALILVLSVVVAAQGVGWWVLLIGAARYLLGAASVPWPWLAAPSPPRRWAKVVAAIQGVALTAAASGWFPLPLIRGVLLVALALLAESFGRQVGWLRRHRAQAPGRSRTAAGTLLAGLLVWAALVLPDRPGQLGWPVLARVPVEAGVLLVAAAVLSAAVARRVAVLVGLLLAIAVLLRLLDLGFRSVLDRPFDPLFDLTFLRSGLGVLVDSSGRLVALGAVAGALLTVVLLLTVLPWALLRLLGAARRRRLEALVAGAALSLVWVVTAATGAQLPPGQAVASAASVGRAVRVVTDARFDVADRRVFARAIATDPMGASPGLLRRLRGHDVLLVFVESYGRVAVEGAPFSPSVARTLDAGTARLAAAGFHARSAYLTSPTFGAASWLAHSTLQSGLWVNSQRRYEQLLGSDRTTLTSAFSRAGWRTVFDVPAVTQPWPEGRRFYGFDTLYDAHDVGYRGPAFGYATMPDQFTLDAFGRRELTAGDRPPVMAEIDLVSSHHPWTPLPRMVPWSAVGDGSVFDPMPARGRSADEAFRDPATVRALYGRSIVYSWRSLVSFLARVHDPGLVLVVLGDHQPHSYVTGPAPGHDVPVSVIARDPRVLRRVAAWGWRPGLRPSDAAPVWPMSAFRDTFLSTFSGGRG